MTPETRPLILIVALTGCRLRNPLNNSQGFTRGATFAKAKERKAQRSGTLGQLQRSCALFPKLRACAMATFNGPGLTVEITRIAPSSGLDDDALPASCKSVRDGVADWLGTHDRDPRISWTYAQRRGKPKEYGVEVRVMAREQKERTA